MGDDHAASTDAPGHLCSSAHHPGSAIGSGAAVFQQSALLTLLLMLAVTAAGCAAVGGIFKAGLWVGLVIAVVVVVLVLVLVRSISR